MTQNSIAKTLSNMAVSSKWFRALKRIYVCGKWYKKGDVFQVGCANCGIALINNGLAEEVK